MSATVFKDYPAANTRNKVDKVTGLQSPLSELVPRTKKASGGKRKVKKCKSTTPITSFLHNLKEAEIEISSDIEFDAEKTLRTRSLSGNIYTSSLVIETEPSSTQPLLVHDLSAIARSDPANRESLTTLLNSVKQTVTVKPSSKDDLSVAQNCKQTTRMQNAPITTEMRNTPTSQADASVDDGAKISATVAVTTKQTNPSLSTMAPITATAGVTNSPSVMQAQTGATYTPPSFPIKATVMSTMPVVCSTTAMGTQMIHQYQQAQQFNDLYYGGMHQPRNPMQVQLEGINKTLTQMASDMKYYSQQNHQLGERLDGCEFEQEIEFIKRRKQDKQIKDLEDKVCLLTKLVCSQDTELTALKNKLKFDEKQQTKTTLIIHGIVNDSSKTEMQLIESFFKDDMKLASNPPRVISAYWSRKGKNEDDASNTSPMIVKLKAFEDKKKVFDNLKNLKGHKNAKGKYFSIRSQQPDSFNEDDIRKRSIFQSNKKLPPANKQQMELKKGTLTINGVKYAKKVSVLDASRMLHMTNDEIQVFKCVEISSGTVKKDSGSVFAGYAAEVATIDDVRNIYTHLKIKYADAAHVIMAYRLAGLDKAYDEDYLDDGEHGGGRRLLKHMIDSDITGRMVVVTRYFGHVYLGPKRFDHITSAAQDALTLLANGQTFNSKLDLHAAPPIPPEQLKPRAQRRSNLPRSFTGPYAAPHAPMQPSSQPIRRAAPLRVTPNAPLWSSQPPPMSSNRFHLLADDSTDGEISFDLPRSQYASLDDLTQPEDWNTEDRGQWADA